MAKPEIYLSIPILDFTGSTLSHDTLLPPHQASSLLLQSERLKTSGCNIQIIEERAEHTDLNLLCVPRFGCL